MRGTLAPSARLPARPSGHWKPLTTAVIYHSYISRSPAQRPSCPPTDDGSLAQRPARTTRIRELIVTLELPPGLADQRARADGAARARAHAGPRGAARRSRRRSSSRSIPAAASSSRPSTSATSPRSPRCGSRSRASRPASPPSARTEDDRAVARGAARRAAGRRAPRHDERALIELDQRIHRHVYRCAHNPFVESTLNEYYTLTLRIWFLALDRVARLDDAVTEHRELLRGDLRRRRRRAPRRSCAATSRASSGRSARCSDTSRSDHDHRARRQRTP